MNRPDHPVPFGHLRGMYVEPGAQELGQTLPDVAERLSTLLHELHRSPTPERAEQVTVELEGARRLAQWLHSALMQEGRHASS